MYPEIRVENPSIKYKTTATLKIKMIVSDGQCLRIDFIAHPDFAYDENWWISIDRDIYIRPTGTDIKLAMVKYENIEIAPKKYYFPSRNWKKYFSLYFQYPAKQTQFIDIIEREGGANCFNFYGVALKKNIRSVCDTGFTINLN